MGGRERGRKEGEKDLLFCMEIIPNSAAPTQAELRAQGMAEWVAAALAPPLQLFWYLNSGCPAIHPSCFPFLLNCPCWTSPGRRPIGGHTRLWVRKETWQETNEGRKNTDYLIKREPRRTQVLMGTMHCETRTLFAKLRT